MRKTRPFAASTRSAKTRQRKRKSTRRSLASKTCKKAAANERRDAARRNAAQRADLQSVVQAELQEACDALLARFRALNDAAAFEQPHGGADYAALQSRVVESNGWRVENAQLRQRLTLIDAKARRFCSTAVGEQTPRLQISDVMNENAYEHWLNEQHTQTNDNLRRRLEAKTLATRELQAEIQCLKTNQAEINSVHAAK